MEYGGRVFEKREYIVLKRILNFHRHYDDFLSKEVFHILSDGLARASIKNNEEMPSTIVRLNSKVTLANEDGQTFTVRLVLPSEKNNGVKSLSVISVLGANLIGLKVGERVLNGLPPQSNTVEIVEVERPGRLATNIVFGMDPLL